MAVKIASWNVEGRLQGYAKKGRGTAEDILRGIEALGADVLVVPEAYLDQLAGGVKARLTALGYEIYDTPYGDYGREDEKYLIGTMHLLLLSKLPVEDGRQLRPGDVRNLLACKVTDPETGKKLRVVAIHLDDRNEAARLLQAGDLVKQFENETEPMVMLGDFNAMWHTGRARLISSRLVSWLARRLLLGHARYVAVRAVEMGVGKALKMLASGLRLRDADQRLRPTVTPKQLGLLVLPSIRLMQIDHMLVSSNVKVRDFSISDDIGSDHRAISALLTID